MFVGEAVLLCEPDEISEVAVGFSERLSRPTSYVERLVLRALLIELAIRWGSLVHAQAHYGKLDQPCAFMATRALDRLCDRAHLSATEGFVAWARAFSADLMRTHPASPAQRVCSILRSPDGEPLSVGQLARLVGVTPGWLRRAFRRERGMALPEYLRRVRLLHALRTLIDEGGKIEPVALEVGYRGKKNFYRVFKQLTGLTPTQFRKLPAGAARQIVEDNRLALLGHARRGLNLADAGLRIPAASQPDQRTYAQ
jgi:AraC-like DNA-binding protein